MSIFHTLFDWLIGSDATGFDEFTPPQQDIGCQNPATGLPMASGNCSGMDIAGNPYCTDLSSIHSHTSSSFDTGSGWSGMPGSSDPFSLWGD